MGSSSANTSSDPYSIPWTDTQRMRNELNDLETQQNDLLVLNGGYMTTDILPQYRAYQNQIDQLNKKLAGADTSVQNVAAPMNTPGSGGRFATLGDAYVDFLEQEGVVFKDSVVNSNAEANGAAGVNQGNGVQFAHGDADYADRLKDIYAAAMESDNTSEYLASQGYRNLQELTNAIQYAVGPLEYLTFKDDVADGRYTAPHEKDGQASEITDYTLNTENYEADEDYYGDIITMIAQNPDKRTEILQANGYKYLADVKNDMQNKGPSAYLDLAGKIEAMGYEMPKVDNGGAFALPSTFQVFQDYENMTGEDYLENEGELQKQIAHYQKIADDYLRKANESGGDAEYWQNNEMYNMNKEVIDNLNQQLVDLEDGYIEANYPLKPYPIPDSVGINFDGDQVVVDAILATEIRI